MGGAWPLATFAGLAGVTGLAWAVVARRSARDPRWVARRIEAKHPELDAGLLAAVEQDAAAGPGRLGFLQEAVIGQALEHRRRRDWDDTVPTRTLRGSQLVHAVSLGLFFFATAALAGQAFWKESDRVGLVGATAAEDVEVDPGNTELERGTSLLVVAHFKGAVPAAASLAVEGLSEGTIRRPMTRSLEDPTFAGRVESVDADLSYRVDFAGRSTETYHVKVFEYPELERTDAELVYPVVHVARAEDGRGHPPRHGGRGDRAHPALPAQQGRRRRPAGRREGRGHDALARRRRQLRLPRDLHPGRPAALPRPAGRPGRPAEQADDRDRGQRDPQPPRDGRHDAAGPRRAGLAGRGAEAQGRDRRRLRRGAARRQLHAWPARSRARSS